MKKIMVWSVLLIGAAVFAAAPLFAESDVIDGRTVAEKGTRGNISGTLFEEDGEWFLDSDGKIWELHLGLYGHDSKKISGLSAGEKADVEGFLLDNHAAPVKIVSDGSTYRFRNENGSPLWSGQGNRRNASSYNR